MGYVVAALITILVLGSMVACGPIRAYDKSDQTVTVKSKERTIKNDEGFWQVFGEDEVYSVKDSVWLWRFDASDRYNKLDEGKTYNCEVSGWRVHVLSWYRNILDCQEK